MSSQESTKQLATFTNRTEFRNARMMDRNRSTGAKKMMIDLHMENPDMFSVLNNEEPPCIIDLEDVKFKEEDISRLKMETSKPSIMEVYNILISHDVKLEAMAELGDYGTIRLSNVSITSIRPFSV